MDKRADFAALVEMAMAVAGRKHMRPVIEKELLHYDILFCLDQGGLLDRLTFQGGTALRLCYGSTRFSEDLDFAGGADFAGAQLKEMKACIEHFIGRRYGLEVSVKEPAELREEADYAGVTVDKWQVSVVTAPQRRDLPRQRIKIEVAAIPAYSREPRPLLTNYEFLPDGYSDTLIMTESLDEVMADKLISLVNTVRYVRHRDIWDLRWLKQRGAVVRREWVQSKIGDYGILDYPKRLQTMWHRLPEIIHGEAFRAELGRFIPAEVQERTLHKSKFYDFLVKEIQELLTSVEPGEPGPGVGPGQPDDIS